MPAKNLEVIHAYRHLYQHALRAVQYSTPARHTIRDRLRRAFRKSHAADFDPSRIRNTLQFLKGASNSTCLEHRVLRTLLHTWWWQDVHTASPERIAKMTSKNQNGQEEKRIKGLAYDQFNHLVRMLNESMGMCIR